jgi:hypothetical protein
MGKFKYTLLRGERKSVVLLEGSQTSPVRCSVKSRVKVKLLEWLEAVASDRGHGIFIFSIMWKLYILKK